MTKFRKMLKSFKNYLDTVESLDYEDLRECIMSEAVWDDGCTKRNPTAYEIFATHEHLDFAKEDIFKFAGIELDLDAFTASVKKVEEIWQRRLPELFPGYEFIIYKDPDLRQIAFCRKREGISENPAEIITYLNHAHHNIRWNALFSAKLFPHPDLIPHLIERLDDDDIYNVLKTIIALGASGDTSVIPVLEKRFLKLEEGPDGKYFVNDFFAYDLFNTLIKLGDDGFRPVFGLFKDYKKLDLHTIEHLCELMGKSGRPETLRLLLEIYFTCPEASEYALPGLLAMAKSALPEVLGHLSEKDTETRKKAMWYLASSYHKDARHYLLQGLKDRNSQIREAAVFGIGRFHHRTRKDLLLSATADRANNVRIRAIEALGNLFDNRLMPKFQSLCLDKNPQVRHEAMRAIAALDSQEGLDFLSELYDNSNKSDRLRIIESLYAYTGDPVHLKGLAAKAMASGDTRIIREASDLLEMF